MSTAYVFGVPHRRLKTLHSPVLIVLSMLPDGTVRSRSTTPDAFDHVYPKAGDFERVLDWIHMELSQPLITWSREEAQEHLTTREPSAWGSLSNLDSSLSTDARAERVLRHLERCC